MKECPFCRKEIAYGATVCPYCRMRQSEESGWGILSIWVWMIKNPKEGIIAFIFSFFLIFCANVYVYSRLPKVNLSEGYYCGTLNYVSYGYHDFTMYKKDIKKGYSERCFDSEKYFIKSWYYLFLVFPLKLFTFGYESFYGPHTTEKIELAYKNDKCETYGSLNKTAPEEMEKYIKYLSKKQNRNSGETILVKIKGKIKYKNNSTDFPYLCVEKIEEINN